MLSRPGFPYAPMTPASRRLRPLAALAAACALALAAALALALAAALVLPSPAAASPIAVGLQFENWNDVDLEGSTNPANPTGKAPGWSHLNFDLTGMTNYY